MILLNKCTSEVANKNVTLINNIVTNINNQVVTLEVSALEKIGLYKLENLLKEYYGALNLQEDTTLVTNVRHLEALKEARKNLSAVSLGLRTGSPTDLVAQDLRDAITAISSILGEDITPDTVLHHIFKNHCIGK